MGQHNADCTQMTEDNDNLFPAMLQLVTDIGLIVRRNGSGNEYFLFTGNSVKIILPYIAVFFKKLIQLLTYILIMDCNIGILAHDIRLNPAVFGQHKDIITPGRRNKIPWNTMPAGNRVIDRIIKFLCPAQDLCLTVHFFQCTVSGISCTAKRRTVEVIHVKAADPFCQYFCLTPAFFCQGIYK